MWWLRGGHGGGVRRTAENRPNALQGIGFDQSDVINGSAWHQGGDSERLPHLPGDASRDFRGVRVAFDDVLHGHDVFAKVAGAERVRRIRTEGDVVVRA
jgi:hypothetical protein